MQCKNKDGIKKLLPALFLFYWNIHCSLKSGSIKYKCRNRYKAWLSRNLLPDHSCHVFLADISKTAWHMKWGGKKTKEDIFPKLSRETRSADGSYEAHRPRPADGLQTLSWTRPTRTRKPSQFKRRAWKLGISAQRGPQNGVLTIKRNTGSGKKKKNNNNQFWDSDGSIVQIWFFALIGTKSQLLKFYLNQKSCQLRTHPS